eukprot:4242303-Pyramimonas_sp.AAC.1
MVWRQQACPGRRNRHISREACARALSKLLSTHWDAPSAQRCKLQSKSSLRRKARSNCPDRQLCTSLGHQLHGMETNADHAEG